MLEAGTDSPLSFKGDTLLPPRMFSEHQYEDAREAKSESLLIDLVITLFKEAYVFVEKTEKAASDLAEVIDSYLEPMNEEEKRAAIEGGLIEIGKAVQLIDTINEALKEKFPAFCQSLEPSIGQKKAADLQYLVLDNFAKGLEVATFIEERLLVLSFDYADPSEKRSLGPISFKDMKTPEEMIAHLTASGA